MDGSAVVGTYGTERVRVRNASIDVGGVRMLVATDYRKTTVGEEDGLVGLGTERKTLFDGAYDGKQISSRNFVLRLRNYPEPSGLYFNQIPEEIVQSAKYVPTVDKNSWVFFSFKFRPFPTQNYSRTQPTSRPTT
jgi:hypothetical protein